MRFGAMNFKAKYPGKYTLPKDKNKGQSGDLGDYFMEYHLIL